MKHFIIFFTLSLMGCLGAATPEPQEVTKLLNQYTHFLQKLAKAHNLEPAGNNQDCTITGLPLGDYNIIVLRKQDDSHINNLKAKKLPFTCYQLTPIEQVENWFSKHGLVNAGEMTMQHCVNLQTMDIQKTTTNIIVKKVLTEDDLKEFDLISSQAFKDPQGFAFNLLKPLLGHPDITLYLAIHQDEVAGCCIIAIIDGVPLRHWLAVAPCHQKKGIATAMVIEGLHDLKKRGYNEVSVFTTKSSNKVVQWAGFKPFFTFTCWHYKP